MRKAGKEGAVLTGSSVSVAARKCEGLWARGTARTEARVCVPQQGVPGRRQTWSLPRREGQMRPELQGGVSGRCSPCGRAGLVLLQRGRLRL